VHGLKYISSGLTPAGTDAALWLLLALPVAGALACAVLALLSGRRGSAAAALVVGRLASAVAVAAVTATFLAALGLVFGRLVPLPEDQRLLRAWSGGLFTVGGLRVSFGLFLDPLAAVMVLVISGLGALIHLYAAAYMRDDPARPRFFAFLNLFVAAMLLLVLGDGFAPLFFGWEGVGACSYFLIGFWHRRPGAAAAATKAFLANRVGDAAFVLGIGLLLWGMANVSPRPGEVGSIAIEPQLDHGAAQRPSGEDAPIRRRGAARRIPIGPTLSFAEMRDQIDTEIALPRAPVLSTGSAAEMHLFPARRLFERMEVAGVPVGFLVCLLIFLGAAGKSAQLPFSAWLPDAMAGPTPVSALIHAATMVTAGVYLLSRLGFLFALSQGALTVVAVIGTVTALWGAAGALFQNDLKRVLAYSTVSQLGYMFAAAAGVGAGGGAAGIFHVVTHGFFKACLFLSAGIIIHAVEERLARGGLAAHGSGAEDEGGPAGADLRRMGGLASALPWTRAAYLVACVALAGFPIASGFFSKDQIFATLALATNLAVPAPLLLGALAVTTFLTSWYAFRSYYLVFGSRNAAVPLAPATGDVPPAAASEPRLMAGVALVLAAGAVVVGPCLGWPHNWGGEGGGALKRFLAPVFAGTAGSAGVVEVRPAVEWGLQVGGLILATLGLLVARGLHARGERAGRAAPSEAAASSTSSRDRLRRFLASGMGLDAAYRRLAVQPVLAAARAAAWVDREVFDRAVDGIAAAGVSAARLLGAFDRRVIDGAVDGVSSGVVAAGHRAARLQNGRLNSYVLVIVAGMAGLIILVYFLAT
jgi:NADH:ubiquinone oxidoreductase subunit 5 (subunit L)/multisubunit Na+/H+ antiporter MnhA subunit